MEESKKQLNLPIQNQHTHSQINGKDLTISNINDYDRQSYYIKPFLEHCK